MYKTIFILLAIILTLTACSSNKNKQLLSKEDTSALATNSDQMLTFCLDGISRDTKTRWSIQGSREQDIANSKRINN